MLVGVFVGGIIFLATTPYYREDYSECFSGDISSLFPKLSNIEIGHMILFGFQLMILAFLSYFTVLQVKYIFKTLKEQSESEV